ncbi:unnamed protein product, partial [Ixodes pacificus]
RRPHRHYRPLTSIWPARTTAAASKHPYCLVHKGKPWHAPLAPRPSLCRPAKSFPSPTSGEARARVTSGTSSGGPSVPHRRTWARSTHVQRRNRTRGITGRASETGFGSKDHFGN